MHTLFLASKSRSRRELLDFCRIPYKLVAQSADESQHPDLKLLDLVQYLAELKMAHVILDQPEQVTRFPDMQTQATPILNSRSQIVSQASAEPERPIYCWVLTADTLGANSQGEICRKPVDRADAIRMLKSYRVGARTATGYCIDRRRWNFNTNSWELDQRITGVASASYTFNVPDSCLANYLDAAFSGISYLDVSGAVEIERYGVQFLGDIQGSYTAIVGLPMYEVRESLEKLGFYDG
jgi:predicted house-cleaning NTP pyrophosphatase (Maf/HAM1 superfamily)